jgi:hypothetical protein
VVGSTGQGSRARGAGDVVHSCAVRGRDTTLNQSS